MLVATLVEPVETEHGMTCCTASDSKMCTDGCGSVDACLTLACAGASLCIYGLVSPICGEI